MSPAVRWARIITRGLIMLGLLAVANPTPVTPALAADNPIVVENQQPGTSAWQLGSPVADDVNGQIKGYASATSVSQGQSLTLYVTVNPVQTYTLDVYRLGWYQGLGGRLRLHQAGLQGSTQQACTPDATTGLIACNWTPSTTLTIPADWTSGVYLALLTNAAGYQNLILFVVKDGRPAPFLYQEAAMTDEAYNNYPNDQVNGKSLYTYNSYGANTVAGDARAVKVSFDRPMTGGGVGQFINWEYDFIRWMERSGYDVTYQTDVDLHANGAELRNHRALLSSGHTKYWSKEMRDAAENARDAGVNLAFFGSDAASMQTRFESSAGGVANRVLVCYKNAAIDPVQGPTTTVEFRSAPVNRPEQTLEGVQYTSQVPYGSNVGYVVTNSSHWVYANTGFKNGDAVPGLAGYEFDRFMPDFAAPTTTSQVLLSQSPYTSWPAGTADHGNTSIYRAPSGALVFGAGTMSWAYGLDTYGQNLADPRIQQVTANLLGAFLNGPPVTNLKITSPTTVTAGQAFTLTVAAANAQGTPFAQYGGTVHFSSSDTSAGAVLPADSTLGGGQGTFSLTLNKTGPQTVTVSDATNALSTTATLSVTAPTSHLVLAPVSAATTTAGNSFAFRVTAQDQFGSLDPTYAGTLHFTSSDASANVVLPPDSTLTNGQGTFSATLDTAGSQTISGTDTVTATIKGTMTMTVNAASTSHLALAAVAGQTGSAGVPFSFTVSAQDAFGNPNPSYAGRVHFSTTDSSAGVALPADSTLSNGQGTFSATLDKAGSQTITGTDTATATITGTVSVAVNAAPASQLALAPTAGPTATAGNRFAFSVTALDQFGNTASVYAGRVHFSTSDPSAGVVLPPDSTLSNGQGTFSATLDKAGAQTITGTDTASASINGAASVTVNAGPASHLVMATTTAPTATAGNSFSFQVTALDQFGNTAAGYPGRVHFSTSDPSAGVVLPPDSTLSNGQGTFSATLDRAGAQTITGTDSVSSSVAGTVAVQITPAGVTTLSLSSPTSVKLNQPFDVQVTLTDRYGNVATNYTGTVHFATSDMLGSVPADYTFSGTDAGTQTVYFTLRTLSTMLTPSQTVTATDSGNGAINGSSPQITVGA